MFIHLLRRPIALASCAILAVAGSLDAASILIDFGNSGLTTNLDALSRNWNNVTQADDLSGSPFTLLNTTGTDTGFRLTISNPASATNPIGFNSDNSNGVVGPTPPISGEALARNDPASATRDSLFGNTTNFSNGIVESVRLVLSNLNPSELYSFDFFASRLGTGGDNRETEYFITGGAGGTAPTSVFLNVSENTGNIIGASGFSPDASNQIVIDIDRGPNNSNGSGFYYLGVMEVTSVPEPCTLAILGLGMGALLARRRRH
jgi:hypothetical protein